jgi:hypothetical protein
VNKHKLINTKLKTEKKVQKQSWDKSMTIVPLEEEEE